MKPFNYEEFKAGGKAQTRSGKKVLSAYMHDNPGNLLHYPLSVLIEGNSVAVNYAHGGVKVIDRATEFDLFMVDEKVWYQCVFPHYIDDTTFNSIDDAKKFDEYIAIIKVTLTNGTLTAEIVEHYK